MIAMFQNVEEQGKVLRQKDRGERKALKARPIRADSENGEHPALRSVVGVHTNEIKPEKQTRLPRLDSSTALQVIKHIQPKIQFKKVFQCPIQNIFLTVGWYHCFFLLVCL